MTVEVSWEHIATGERKKCCACPLALAIGFATGGSGWLVGYDGEAYAAPLRAAGEFGRNAIGRRFRLPTLATRFLLDFDRGLPVKPFSFEFDPTRPIEQADRPAIIKP